MNDEIKEILDFKENADYKKLSCDEIAILRDYITNLQQENENNKRAINLFNDDLKNMTYQFAKAKSRIEKAVEYIDVITNKVIYESGYGKGTAITICKEHMLDILKGRSDE